MKALVFPALLTIAACQSAPSHPVAAATAKPCAEPEKVCKASEAPEKEASPVQAAAEAFIAAWRSEEADLELRKLLVLPAFHVLYVPTEGPMVVKFINSPELLEGFVEGGPTSLGGYVDVHDERGLACDRHCCELWAPEEDVSNNSYLSRVCFIGGWDEDGEGALAPFRIEIEDTHP